jgi:hypothetical protein
MFYIGAKITTPTAKWVGRSIKANYCHFNKRL